MKKMLINCLITTLISFFSLSANAVPYKITENTNTISDKIIKNTEKEGELILKNIDINKFLKSLEVTGILQNNSEKNWSSINIEFVFYDKNNNIIKDENNDPLTTKILHVLKGENKFDKKIKGDIISKAKKFELKFIEGIVLDDLAYYDFSLIKPKISKELKFENDKIKVFFDISNKEISFILSNKTESPIEINWNKVSYVDFNKTSKKIIHKGTKFNEKDKSQTETLVPPLSNLEDLIIPNENVYYFDNEWVTNTILPDRLTKDSLKLKDKNFSIFMPIKINDKIENYFFTFKVQNVSSYDKFKNKKSTE